MMTKTNHALKFKNLGVDTHQEHVVFMRHDCQVCVSEGFETLTRVKVSNGHKSIVATLNVLYSDLLKPGEVSLSSRAVSELDIDENSVIHVSHLPPIDSLSYVRGKIYGKRFSERELKEIVSDITEGRYSNIHLSAFLTACAGERLNIAEIVYLTRAMIESGNRIKWKNEIVADKHCIGGLPGNRTTPIVVAIIASAGLIMPKTSSRAITSPAGTADTMQVMTRVDLSASEIKNVIEKEGGCVVWGGAASLSPADDILIRVERALDIDSEGQLIASVLSKKAAAGSTHVVIDLPVGETAKLRSYEDASQLKLQIKQVANEVGIKVKVIITDGSQPVGRGIGPALEAIDIMAVLRNEHDAPLDLKNRALMLAGELLQLTGKAGPGKGFDMATEILSSGKALEKFMAICKAQGGFTEPREAKFKKDIYAEFSGSIEKIDNRKLAKVAKLAGAPQDPFAGIRIHTVLGSEVKKGDLLYTVYAESQGELNYAIQFQESQNEIIIINE